MRSSFYRKSAAVIIAASLLMGFVPMWGDFSAASPFSISASATETQVEVSSWSELQTAINESSGATTITVIPESDYRIQPKEGDSFLYVPADKVITLNLNSWIDRGLSEPTENGYVIKNDGTLTITGNDRSITGGYNIGDGGCIYNGGTLTLQRNITLYGNKTQGNGGCIYNAQGAVLNLCGDTVSGNTADGMGGGIYNDGTINAYHLQYKVDEDDEDYSYSDTTVKDNTSGAQGGGIFCTSGSTFNVSGALRVEMNNSNQVDGAYNNVYLSGNSMMNVTGEMTTPGNYEGNVIYSNIGVTMEIPGVFTNGFKTNNPTLSARGLFNSDIFDVMCTESGGEASLLHSDWYEVQDEINTIAETDEKEGTITLDGDCIAYDWYYSYESRYASSLNIPEGVKITLDLAGYKIDRNLNDYDYYTDDWSGDYGSSACVICNEGSLTIIDSSNDQTGMITGGSGIGNYDDCAGGIYNRENAVLTINSGKITGNRGPVGGILNEGTLCFYGGEISDNYSSNGNPAGIKNSGVVHVKGAPIVRDNRSVINGYNDETSESYYYTIVSNYGVNYNNGSRIIVDGALSDGTKKAEIHVASSSPVITSGYSDYNDEAPAEYFVSDNENKTIEKSTEGEAMLAVADHFLGANITLSDMIGVDFHFNSEIGEYIAVEFSWGDDNTQLVDAVSQYINNKDELVATCTFPPKELIDTICYSVKCYEYVYDEDTCLYEKKNYSTLYEGSYNVKEQYIAAIIEDTNNEKYSQQDQQMVKAIANYAAAAQTLFAYKPETLINEGLAYSPSVTITGLGDFKNSQRDITEPQDNTIKGMTCSYYGSTLVLNDRISLRHYFKLENVELDSVDCKMAYTAEKATGAWQLYHPALTKVESSDNLYYVDCLLETPGIGEPKKYGIPADRLLDSIHHCIEYRYNDGTLDNIDQVCDFDYNPLDYLYIALKTNKSSAATKAAAEAIYYYAHEAAIYADYLNNV